MPLVLDGTNGVSGVDGTASNPAIEGTDSNTGIFYPAADTVAIATGGSQRAVVDASGRVGIGETSPAVTLHLKAAVCNVRLEDADTSAYANVGVDNSGSMYLQADPSNSQANTAIYFATDGTERARITSVGDWLIGTTSTSLTANVGAKFIASATDTYMGYVVNTAAGSNYHYYNTNATNNGYRFYVSINGGIYNYSGNNSNLSDVRTKKDIEISNDYLEKICSIPVKTFRYKDQDDDATTLGVIAQDVEMIAPELVNTAGFGDTPEDGVPLKSIYTTDMMFALMKSIQELNAKVEAQAAEIAALKGNA